MVAPKQPVLIKYYIILRVSLARYVLNCKLGHDFRNQTSILFSNSLGVLHLLWREPLHLQLYIYMYIFHASFLKYLLQIWLNSAPPHFTDG
uniref:Putative secreted protein n=1 Tax=Panstrongylus lignarius TaxID=156445 RepID=A0A224XRQ0_9HEMI